MKIMGIETSCDETAISIIEISEKDNIKVLSNIVSSQVKIHAKYGGVFPALAAREHAKNIDKVLKLALKEADLKSVEEIDLITVTKGPGLAVALIVGITFAKTLAWKYKKPIIGVNHLEGHIYSNWLPPTEGIMNQGSGIRNETIIHNSKFLIPFPVLNLIVSGGHTELVLMKNHGQYKVIGETVDDAAGEAFDKIARLLGLGYPGGPLISQEAEKWMINSSKSGIQPLEDSRSRSRGSKVARIPDLQEIALPRPMINSKDFNFSFSGLKTAVLYLVKDLSSRFNLDKIRPAVAYEAQQAIVDVLVAKTAKAAKKYKPKSILLSGGVSANSQLRINLNKAGEKMGISYFQPELKYTGDNAAMIALAGHFNYAKQKQGKTDSWKSAKIKVDANLRISTVRKKNFIISGQSNLPRPAFKKLGI